MIDETYKAACLGCKKEFDFDPKLCCSGHMCGCYGRPTEPQVCSVECYEKVYQSHKEDSN